MRCSSSSATVCDGRKTFEEPDQEFFYFYDVMTGRGVDRIQPDPSDPRIYRQVVSDARTYGPCGIASRRSRNS